MMVVPVGAAMNMEDVAAGDGASDSSMEELMSLGRHLELLKMLKMMKGMEQPAVNPPCPFPKLTGAQWVHLNLSNKNRCKNNLRMSLDAFLHSLLDFPPNATHKMCCNMPYLVAIDTIATKSPFRCNSTPLLQPK
jgi:hypothetical protein